MNTKLFIAEKVKVGFNPRTDTYSGKLGYVIGYDGKKWRKEPSWEGWRYHYMDSDEYEQKKRQQYNDRAESLRKQHASYVEDAKKNPNNTWYAQYAKMTEEQYLKTYLGEYEKFNPSLGRVSSDKNLLPIEFENVPTEGFVLNKKVGGYSNGWDHRSTYCRVYDPRGFEFEITVPNLLFILQECNAMKGKGLEGTFVYAWDGKDLVLLPTTSLDYQESQKFTELQSGKIGVKDLVEGCVYKTKQMEDYIYLGKFNWFVDGYTGNLSNINSVWCSKSHVFYKVEKPSWGERFEAFNGLTKFASRVSDTPVSNYAEILDEFNKSKFSGILANIETVDAKIPTKAHYSYRNSDYLGSALLPLGNDSYEVYEIEQDEVNRRSYYSNNNDIINYKLISKKILMFVDGDFKMKTTKPKLLEKVRFHELTKMELKLLKMKKNNNEKILEFN